MAQRTDAGIARQAKYILHRPEAGYQEFLIVLRNYNNALNPESTGSTESLSCLALPERNVPNGSRLA
jgi:hypothetical protein